jgi:hypothetical protein
MQTPVIIEWPYVAMVTYGDGVSQKTQFTSPGAALQYLKMMEQRGKVVEDGRVVRLYRVFVEEVRL